jgi:hypothetical protein
MGLGSKFLATLVILAGTAVFTAFIFLNPPFQSFFWALVGRNILYASIGIITVYASVIALASWLWNR